MIRRCCYGEEIPAGVDPAQAEAERPVAGPAGRCGRGCGVCSRELTDSGAVLLHADSVRGGETMKRVPTLMDEAEFREYLERQKKAVEQMKKDGVDYMSRLCRLWGIVTATAGEENEKCYMASQLDQIFDLAK